MIAMALVGAALGGLLFAVLLRLAPPRLSPLVQLGRLDAQYQAAGSGREVISGRNQGGLGTVGRVLPCRAGWVGWSRPGSPTAASVTPACVRTSP